MEDVLSPAPSAVRLLPMGDSAWTVEFGDRIDPQLHAQVLGFLDALEVARKDNAGLFSGIVDVVPTFRSLTVHYDPLKSEAEKLGEALVTIAKSAGSVDKVGRHWRLPVCFEEGFSLDLDDLAKAKNMRVDEVITLLTQATFKVYMVGFMPGFPYMGGLPPVLEMPRLANPRKALPARSFGIAGSMCAVYPWESPGGWRILGRTPLSMFSVEEKESPSLLNSGDRVRLQAIDAKTYAEMEADLAAGKLTRQHFIESQGA